LLAFVPVAWRHHALAASHLIVSASNWSAWIPVSSRRYPKDSDKIMLAKQTGLTRSQVSNWFINARVRLWKPMVEEMYLEETKDQDGGGNDEGKSGGGGSKSGDTVDGVTPRADAMSSKSAVVRVGGGGGAAESASTNKGIHGSSLLELGGGGDHQQSHAGFYDDDEDDGDDAMGRRLKKAAATT